MKNSTVLTKILALVGTVFVGLPIVAPLVFGVFSLVRSGRFRFDYLMPAELLFLVLAGAALLIWAAIRAKKYRKEMLWTMGIGAVVLAAALGFAQISGLDEGRVGEDSWQFAATLGGIILFDLAVLALFVIGIRLTVHVFKKQA